MTSACATTPENAKSDGASNGRASGKNLPPIAAVMRLARALWPLKTDLQLSEITGTPDRTCRYWLERETNIPGEALIELLRSEYGLKFLEAALGANKPKWWRAFKQQTEIGLLRQRQEEIRRDLERLERDFGA